MLPAWLNERHWNALNQLLDVLNTTQVTYQFTGGLAGNIYGSNWPLHDIDIDLYQADIPQVISRLQSFVTRPYSRYQDDEFDLFLVTLSIDGISVDLSQVEDAFLIAQGVPHPLPATLASRQKQFLLGHEVWVQPLEQLIAYKRVIGRFADVADLEQLRQSETLPQVKQES